LAPPAALFEIAEASPRGARPDRPPIETVGGVPAETLRRPLAGTPDAVRATAAPDPCDVACLADGTCISAAAARRLSPSPRGRSDPDRRSRRLRRQADRQAPTNECWTALAL